MSDFPASTSYSADARSLTPPEDLLEGLLAVSLTGVALYKPVYARPGSPEIIDFTFVLLNPKARQILGLTELPTQTYLQLYPHTLATGVFEFHCQAFASGRQQQYSVNYQGDGLDNFFHLSARRVGEGLLVSFTDTAEQSRTAVEEALRESQAREKAARAEAETQRNQLHSLFMQAPAMITIFEGPDHVFRLVNPLYQELVGTRLLLGKPIREAMPELAGQPIFDLLDEVYRTGETFRATEMQVQLDHDNSGRLGERYYNFIYQATRSQAGEVNGILVFAYDVTEQVLARQRVEHSERQLSYANEELAATNEELAATNEELLAANHEILINTSELERRVAARTKEVLHAQADAERRRVRLEQLFMQAPAAICILRGPELVFELVNPGYQGLFPGRALLGRPILEALPEIARHPVYHTFRQVYATGEMHQELGMLIPLSHPDADAPRDRYFNYIQQPRYNENGQIDGVIVFAYEVTELEQARRQLEQSELGFRTLTNAISNLVWTTSPAGQADYYNEQWYAFTGSTPEEALGKGWTRYFHPQDLPFMLRQWNIALTEATPYQVEARLRRANGTYRWFLVRALPLHDEQGRIVRWFGTNTDIHEQKELAEALQLASRKLATSNKELRAANEQARLSNRQLELTNQQLTRINSDLDNFVYTASHDLQQPVHNMAGIFEELKRTATFHDPEAEQLMHMFEDALGQIQRTIQGLAQVVQAERQTQGVPAEVVALLPLTQSVLQSMRNQITEQQAQVELDFAAVPQLLFGRLNLQSILYNLISNALKYAHPDRPPVVLVSVRLTAGGSPLLLVQDNGLGMDLSRFGPELFKMFRRFHDHVPGSGLGLYLVNRIVQQAGGHVEVSSTLGTGTTFRLHLPASLVPAL
ncbi:PAS domain S-box-containing protein [Hymenobacter luteus]|uniref:histidine kinase n=2 Tax=Hymenobacter TaxID=89966 RepID=A0A7W9T3J9_9BACT|nr:PAS domain-containing protein [Hymenobacter latericoloratus]MBB4603095.1 PAS domain S-box-containing protein [Hymenobacter latericoloratus]MBB6060946.1 PAS domain S-box-containing protein [Hymenobacter luteus]